MPMPFPPEEQTPESRIAESKGMCILNFNCHPQILSPKDTQLILPVAVHDMRVFLRPSQQWILKVQNFSNPLGKKMRFLLLLPFTFEYVFCHIFVAVSTPSVCSIY